MKFVKVDSSGPVVAHLVRAISEQLQTGKSVLWLVSGGSAISTAVDTAKALAGKQLERLTISLVDERYGPIAHPTSNWLQLEAAGFSLPGAYLRPILTGKDMGQTVHEFAVLLKQAIQEPNTYIIGLFGMGKDGHAAGLLPHSVGLTSQELVVGYDGGDFQRITPTPAALSQFDEAVLLVTGQEKWPVIDALAGAVSPQDQPAQVLKSIAKLTVYNDHRSSDE